MENKKEKPLKIEADFEDVLKVSVKEKKEQKEKKKLKTNK